MGRPESIAFEDPVMGPIVLALRGTGLAGAFATPDTEGLKELLELPLPGPGRRTLNRRPAACGGR